MLPGIAFAIALLLIGGWLLSREKQQDLSLLVESRLPRITLVSIYCLDCAGYELLPKKTFLTSAGRCAKCYGRSYVPASTWAPAIRARLQHQLRAAQARERTRKIEKQIV